MAIRADSGAAARLADRAIELPRNVLSAEAVPDLLGGLTPTGRPDQWRLFFHCFLPFIFHYHGRISFHRAATAAIATPRVVVEWSLGGLCAVTI